MPPPEASSRASSPAAMPPSLPMAPLVRGSGMGPIWQGLQRESRPQMSHPLSPRLREDLHHAWHRQRAWHLCPRPG